MLLSTGVSSYVLRNASSLSFRSPVRSLKLEMFRGVTPEYVYSSNVTLHLQLPSSLSISDQPLRI